MQDSALCNFIEPRKFDIRKSKLSVNPGVQGTAAAFSTAGKVFLLAGLIAASGATSASAQNTIPDSQVEASVLKSMAGAPELAGQNISTNTVYGVVTLSGTVPDEATRTKAETLASNTPGVKKVVDELQLGSSADAQGGAPAQGGTPAPGMVLQSDGTYAPANSSSESSTQPGSPAPGTAPAEGAVMNDPDHDQSSSNQGSNGMTPNTSGGINQAPPAQPQTYPHGNASVPNQQSYPQPLGGNSNYPQNGYPQGGYPQNGYPQQGYPQGRYPQNSYPQNGMAQGGAVPYGGQVGGQPVQIPAGTTVRIRVNRLLASDKLTAGDRFDGVVANDVTASGYVAIPRGATVGGVVIGSKSSGAISGRGELSLQLTSVALGGKVYPVTSEVWQQSGPDKTGHTISNAAGLGLVGALIGGIAGRGAGAAIGAGVGAGAGVAASAASPRGQVVIPPEGMVTFSLAEPASMTTVSEQEMQRMAYGVSNGPAPRQPMYARPYPGYYNGYPPPPPNAGYPPY